MNVEAILAEHGMTGELLQIGKDRYQLRGLIGSNGAAAEIDGEPDETVIREAADAIARELND